MQKEQRISGQKEEGKNYEEFLDETQEDIQVSEEGEGGDGLSDAELHPKTPNLEKPERGVWEKVCKGGFRKVSREPRQIFNDGEVFPMSGTSNVMNNRKYNIFLFLPMFLWEQYKYFGNLYFLLLAVTQFFEKLKVGFMITYIGPIIIILGFSLAKELWDHYNTWRKDEEYNKEKFEVFRQGQWRLLDSARIKVGDLVRLEKKQRVPADMVYLGYSKKDSRRGGQSMQSSQVGSEMSLTQHDPTLQSQRTFASTFVTTDQLDGETDLKPRESLKFTFQLLREGETSLTRTPWKMDVEIPNEQIYSFKGILSWGEGREGVRLKNTLWMGMRVTTNGVVGMVIFNGNETKMALNSRKKTSKMGKTDLEIDRLILSLFFILASISGLITLTSGNFTSWESLFYLLRILILLSSIIPISMRVLTDFAKIFYCIEIRKDKEMPQTVTRNSGIPEELARIEYLLSDKTGTLTRNEMIFREFRTKTIDVKTSDFSNLKSFLGGGTRKNNTSNFMEKQEDKDREEGIQKNYPFDSSEFMTDNSSRLSSKSKSIQSQRNIFSNLRDAEDGERPSHMFDRNTLSKGQMKDHLEQRILGFLLCNNVKVGKDEEGKRVIQGASPDELCIVDFARSLDFEILSRSKHHICLRNPRNEETKYSILREFPFSSERKRMGILVSKSVRPGSGTNHREDSQDQDQGDVLFILKGADSVMEKLVKNPEHRQYIKETTEDLAKQGFRTLVYGSKTLSKREFNEWQRKLGEAEQEEMQVELRGDRVEKTRTEDLCNEMERGLDFLCVTGVEDLLRQGVRSSITSFREAGIKVWMLTGDKLETAKCVSICTGFKAENQDFLSISGVSPDEIEFQLDRLITKSIRKSASLGRNSNFYSSNYNDFQINPGDTQGHRLSSSGDLQITKILIDDKCLVISGDTLDCILKDKALRKKFLSKAPLASSVVLCRCAPKQKSTIASLLKNTLGKVVCSVGDGGNDVGMIQASSLGVGIEGREGRQAALASDISVVEFSHLQQLLFWHGRLSYLRTAKLCNFVIHRGIIVTVIQALFIVTYYFVSISIYNGLTLLGYSTIFTTLPIFMLILDKDLPREQALNYPILYKYLQQGRDLNPLVFLSWLFQSIFQGSFVLLTGVFFYHELSFSKIVTTTFLALLIIGKSSFGTPVIPCVVIS
jgi:phospholipid-translocating ATPase